MAQTLDYKNYPPNYQSYKARAEKNFPNSEIITEEEFNSIVKEECHYCGKEGLNGIDRVDNTKG